MEIFSISDHHANTSIEVDAASSLIPDSDHIHMPHRHASCSSDHSKRNELTYIRIRKDLAANYLKVKTEVNGEKQSRDAAAHRSSMEAFMESNCCSPLLIFNTR